MENGINSIGVWGDSILKGAVTGYSDHLFDVLEDENSLTLASRQLGFSLKNFSVFGNVLAKSQRRMMRTLESGKTYDLGIIESGGNDCDYDWQPVSDEPDAPHEMRTPLPIFLRMLGEMVDALREQKITPLLTTMPPLVPDRWFKQITRDRNEQAILQFLGGNPFKPYTTHELYSTEIFYFARERGVQLVDLRRAMLSAPNYRDLMCEDGIHPNKAGYAYLAEVWVRELPKLQKEF